MKKKAKKAKASKPAGKRGGARKDIRALHEAGKDVTEKRGNSFYWTNPGSAIRHLSGCSALTVPTHDVRPRIQKVATVKSNVPDGDYPYNCIPPARGIKTNPKIIIRG